MIDDSMLVHTWRLWLLRAVWVSLPVSAGPAVESATRTWSSGAQAAAEVLLWAAWGIGLLATLAPRPPALAALRAIAPAFAVVAVAAVCTGRPSALASVGALVVTFACAVLASGHDIAIASANAQSYGDELRVPLRTPPALFVAPIPLARVIAVAAVAAPVLLLADGRVVAGVVAVVIAVPALWLAARALYGLVRRWAVLVPAGFVVVDPLTLTDPVLFLRERVASLAPAPPGGAPPGATDLRLGATLGSVVLVCREPAVIGRAARGRGVSESVSTDTLLVAVVRREGLLARAAARRLPVRPAA